MGPASPVGPVSPAGPVTPVGPTGPGSPICPCGPTSPMGPNDTLLIVPSILRNAESKYNIEPIGLAVCLTNSSALKNLTFDPSYVMVYTVDAYSESFPTYIGVPDS